MITIVFEAHATSVDNEAKISSGHADPILSELGKQQARDLGMRHAHEHFDAIFCSDLRRSYETAQIAFADKKYPIIRDPRLRECDYGEFTRHQSAEVEPIKAQHITVPFPQGESYEQAVERMRDFLDSLSQTYNGKTVMIIGHRATQYGLEHWVNGIPLENIVTAPWVWQPGWTYTLRTELPTGR